MRSSTSGGDETVELRGRVVRSVSRVPIITGSVTSAGLAEVTCEHVEGEIVALGFGSYPGGNGRIVFEGPPLDLLALLVRAIGVVKRKNRDLGLPRLVDDGLEEIDPVDADRG